MKFAKLRVENAYQNLSGVFNARSEQFSSQSHGEKSTSIQAGTFSWVPGDTVPRPTFSATILNGKCHQYFTNSFEIVSVAIEEHISIENIIHFSWPTLIEHTSADELAQRTPQTDHRIHTCMTVFRFRASARNSWSCSSPSAIYNDNVCRPPRGLHQALRRYTWEEKQHARFWLHDIETLMHRQMLDCKERNDLRR